MNLGQEMHPLTDFKRKTPEFLRQLKETGNPVVLTIKDPRKNKLSNFIGEV